MFEVFKELVAKGYYPDAVALDYFMEDPKLLLLTNGTVLEYITDHILCMEASALVAPLHIKILNDLDKRRTLLDKVISHGTAYKIRRATILDMLSDTTKELNEEEVNDFLYTSN